jgi:hypothetical protein
MKGNFSAWHRRAADSGYDYFLVTFSTAESIQDRIYFYSCYG